MRGKIKVVMNASDIRNGRKGSTCACPVARATRRAYTKSRGHRVPTRALRAGLSGVLIEGMFYRYSVSQKVMNFIIAFDRGEKQLTPIKFHIVEEGLTY